MVLRSLSSSASRRIPSLSSLSNFTSSFLSSSITPIRQSRSSPRLFSFTSIANNQTRGDEYLIMKGVIASRNFSSLIIGSLTDARYPKRRPGSKPRRKRASLKPPGPYAWVQYVPGEPIPRSRPNEGSVKGRKRKKRIAQRKAFILCEKKKRKVQYQESRKKKAMERTERKMAAVARDKAWAERLIELQKVEAEKKAATA